jgi:hypothetical protein
MWAICALRVFGLQYDGPNATMDQLDYRKLPMHNGPAVSRLHGVHYQSVVKVTGLPQLLLCPLTLHRLTRSFRLYSFHPNATFDRSAGSSSSVHLSMPVNKYWHQSGCDTPVDSALRVCRLLSLVQYQGTRWICRLFLSRWGVTRGESTTAVAATPHIDI